VPVIFGKLRCARLIVPTSHGSAKPSPFRHLAFCGGNKDAEMLNSIIFSSSFHCHVLGPDLRETFDDPAVAAASRIAPQQEQTFN
jgi:hypothetical protein